SNSHHLPASLRCESTSRGGPNGSGRPLLASTVFLPEPSAPTSRNHGIAIRFFCVTVSPSRESSDFSSDSLSAIIRLLRAPPRYSSVVVENSSFFPPSADVIM